MDTSSKQEKPLPPGMRVPIFVSPSPSCEWMTNSWSEIIDEVCTLLQSVDTTLRDKILPADVYLQVVEKKRSLETAIRRRKRLGNEVWRSFKTLQQAHNDILSGNSSGDDGQYIRNSSVRFALAPHQSQSVVPAVGLVARRSICFDGDYPIRPLPSLKAFPHEAGSCLEMISTTLIKCGKELELYDEESQTINRIAGIGLGLAVFVAICTVVYYS